MNQVLFSQNFNFNEIHFRHYHHTDQSNGAPLNYLAYLKSGHCTIVAPHRTIEINAGDVFLIPINLPYHSYWEGAEDIVCLSYGFASLHTDEQSGMELQVLQCDESTKEKIRSVSTKRPLTSTTLASFYTAMASIVPFIERTPLKKNEKIAETVKKYLTAHPDSTMTDVARVCAVGESHLYFSFKSATGITPNEFRQRILCERGINLLTTTNKTVEEISGILGMSSGSYFRKVLKKNSGLTPSQIRKHKTV